jgi:F-type H+-transporting ATPase subunit gamma
MSGKLIDLRRRIKSINDTQKTTRAMKTVSAVKLRKATAELKNSRPYLTKVEHLLSQLKKEVAVENFPFCQERSGGTYVVVAVSSDKGLCGAFNSHLIKRADEHCRSLKEQGEEVCLVTVGNKVSQYFQKSEEFPIKRAEQKTMAKLQYADAIKLSEYLQDIFLSEEIKTVELVYTAFISTASQNLSIKTLFPLKLELEQPGKEAEADREYIFEPAPEEIFRTYLSRYIHSLVYRTLLESSASEHAARMIAMDLATRNAGEMIRSLTLTMNKLRQASITKELLEIITATEALKG